MKLLKIALSAAAIWLPVTLTQAITFDLGGNAGGGTDGNKISFTEEGLTVTASAWHSNRSRTTWFDRKLGQWGAGLGVGGDDSHTVDNRNGLDYVLFEFSENVNPLSVFLRSFNPSGPLNGDTDIQFWVGNASVDNDPNTTDFTSIDFASLMFGGTNYGGRSSRLANLDTDLTGNALLVGASKAGNRKDSFKIKTLSVERASVPDTGSTLALLGFGLVGLLATRRRIKN